MEHEIIKIMKEQGCRWLWCDKSRTHGDDDDDDDNRGDAIDLT
jgi:hypothetical protein